MSQPAMIFSAVVLLSIVVAAFYGLFIYPRQRRQHLLRQPFPASWQALLEERMALYRRLPQSRRASLHNHLRLLLDRVEFYGCAGVTVDEPMKVLIAAHGALLVNGLSPTYYRRLRSILVYPGAYRVQEAVHDGEVLNHSAQERLGESWEQGRLVLAWDTLAREAADEHADSNVALHEFAHQLDQVDGQSDGAPPLASAELAEHWQTVFSDAWHRRQRGGHHSVIDEYGATSPAEFFAVTSETFFLHPRALAHEEPELYRCLSAFYHLDPAHW
ncbi:M90 family metallopeptidase [Marinobacter xestospongiae]|uniref:Zinc-dependent peptidase n=1 Tax=Marinobacter xestospongiae TaxID=994319 RepID=A0ABU3VYZ9_9GAMM|nr:zinc-dependent peptidase [Marinobacter xestospongiae]MDV2079515.1 zinc-dependent peptidase [Marinobacter xestospongiae]